MTTHTADTFHVAVYGGTGRGWFVAEMFDPVEDERGTFYRDARTAAGPYTSKAQAQAEADRRNAEAQA